MLSEDRLRRLRDALACEGYSADDVEGIVAGIVRTEEACDARRCEYCGRAVAPDPYPDQRGAAPGQAWVRYWCAKPAGCGNIVVRLEAS